MKRLFAIGISALLGASTIMVSAWAGQAGRGTPGGPAPTAGSCDRACLTGIADAYLAAVVAHDPSKAPMAPNAKFVEQAKMIPIGDGVLWKYATGVSTTFKIPVADPIAGQIGMIVMLRESGTAPSGAPTRGAAPSTTPAGPPPDRDVQLALRLKILNRQITEAEHIFAVINGASLANLQTPRPSLLATVPPAERLSRELMLLVGNSYYDSIVQNDGNAAPYADDCERHENGAVTSGGPGTGNRPPAPIPPAPAGGAAPRGGGFVRRACKEEMTSRWLSYITSIDLRRVWIADEERGLVFGLTMFRQPMEEKTLTLLNPDGTTTPRPMTNAPFDLEAAHIFKIQGGKLHDIEAMGFTLPLNSKNGWTDFTR